MGESAKVVPGDGQVDREIIRRAEEEYATAARRLGEQYALWELRRSEMVRDVVAADARRKVAQPKGPGGVPILKPTFTDKVEDE